VFWFKAHLAGASSAQVPWAWQDTSIKLLEETSTPTVISIPVPINTKSPIAIVKQALTQSKTPQQAVGTFFAFREGKKTLPKVDVAFTYLILYKFWC
jgi:deoxyinosine 3'endonuclease (endonuclease V)